jgi:hypothetical protein
MTANEQATNSEMKARWATFGALAMVYAALKARSLEAACPDDGRRGLPAPRRRNENHREDDGVRVKGETGLLDMRRAVAAKLKRLNGKTQAGELRNRLAVDRE